VSRFRYTRQHQPPPDCERAPDHGDRGAAIVEFALSAIVLLTLVFGVIEGGLLFRSKLALSNSADEAARRGSVASNSPNADYEILQQLLRHSADGGGSIDSIVIYRATSPTAGPATGCLDGSATIDCNRYVPADFARPESDFGSCGALDGGWCPTDRRTDLAGDLLGVWVEGSHQPITGFMKEISLTQQAVLPLESIGGGE